MKKLTQSYLEYWGRPKVPEPSGMRVVARIIVSLLIVLLLSIGIKKSFSRPCMLTFVPPACVTNGIVARYDILISTTNNQQGQWLGSVNVGSTNYLFDTTNLPLPNPVLLYADTIGINGSQSAYSVPFLFDTNTFTVDMTNAMALTVTNYVFSPPSFISATMPPFTNYFVIYTTNFVTVTNR
jgi:hypothetical protein